MKEIFIKKFHELQLEELYEILKLRIDIFVVEQRCPYHELDGKDKESLHLFYKFSGEIAAYLRIIPKGEVYDTVSFGRVCVKQKYRNKKIARILVQQAINYITEVMQEGVITIGAQVYLTDFYASLGFRACSEQYDEDGIPHIDMQKCVNIG